VLVLAPAATAAPSADAPTVSASAALFACAGTPTVCQQRADAPADATMLVTPLMGSESAYAWSRGVGVSTDDGGTTTMTPVADGAVITSLAVSGGRLWATVTTSGATTVASSTPGGPWEDMTAADAALRSVGWLVAAPGGRVIDFLTTGGLRCTADGGLTWHRRCP
jgi:hypothetical protein